MAITIRSCRNDACTRLEKCLLIRSTLPCQWKNLRQKKTPSSLRSRTSEMIRCLGKQLRTLRQIAVPSSSKSSSPYSDPAYDRNGSFETSAASYETTRRIIPADVNVRPQWESQISHLLFLLLQPALLFRRSFPLTKHQQTEGTSSFN